MATPQVTGFEFYIDRDTMLGDGSLGNPVRTISRGAYGGAFAAGDYAAGSIVRGGPWLWGSRVATSQAPCVAEKDMGLNADWAINGSATQQASAHTVTLCTGAGQNSTAYNRTIGSLSADWRNRALVIDAQVGPNGGADYFNFGIIDPAVPLNTGVGSPGGLCGVTGAWGINIDFAGNRVGVIVNGVVGSYASIGTGVAVGAGNDLLENQVYYRHRIFMAEEGGLLRIHFFREHFIFDASTMQSRPSFYASWTVAMPTFTQWRWAVGAVAAGAGGQIKAMNPYTQMKPGFGDWDCLAEFPHTPFTNPYDAYGVPYAGM